uniref:Uncharacterized protein n=1 Tax=Tanacetum cinerariifolium TaxID=118510 RepID=A0A6L2L4S8_TANCI|nr:hypothetical protein [Tanacetum cinerariifolium]
MIVLTLQLHVHLMVVNMDPNFKNFIEAMKTLLRLWLMQREAYYDDAITFVRLCKFRVRDGLLQTPIGPQQQVFKIFIPCFDSLNWGLNCKSGEGLM